MVMATAVLKPQRRTDFWKPWRFLAYSDAKSILMDLVGMVGVVVISAIISYNAPTIFRLIYYLALVGVALFSKRDYFWIGFFYFLSNEPAYLFWSAEDQSYIPDIRAVAGITLTIFDLYLLGLLIKAFGWPKVKSYTFFSKPLRYMLLYVLLITLPLSFVDLNSNVLLRQIRFLFYYSLVFSMGRLIKSPEEFFRMALFSLPAMVLILYDQFYTYVNGQVWIAQYNPWFNNFRLVNIFSGTTRAVSGGLRMGFTALLVGAIFQMQTTHSGMRKWGNWIIGLVALSFFLSITRNLIIFLFLFLISTAFFNRSNILKYVLATVVFVFALFGAIHLGLLEATFIQTTMARLGVLAEVASGNLAQSDTLQSRLDNEFVQVQDAWLTSPWLGVGLTSVFQNKFSTDVGFINTLMLFGVVGASIFLTFLLRFAFQLRIQYRQSSRYGKALYLPIMASILASLPLYFTIKDFFLVHPHKVFYFSLLLVFADRIYDREMSLRKHYKKLKNKKV